jgi:hypothetical protein
MQFFSPSVRVQKPAVKISMSLHQQPNLRRCGAITPHLLCTFIINVVVVVVVVVVVKLSLNTITSSP